MMELMREWEAYAAWMGEGREDEPSPEGDDVPQPSEEWEAEWMESLEASQNRVLHALVGDYDPKAQRKG